MSAVVKNADDDEQLAAAMLAMKKAIRKYLNTELIPEIADNAVEEGERNKLLTKMRIRYMNRPVKKYVFPMVVSS